jgi:hypothetical protein
MKESKEGLNWKLRHIERGIIHNTQKFQFIKQHLFWTVLDRPFLFRLLLCLLYQISEHIIVQITFIIILVVSLLSLSRNKTNSHFLNNWQSQSNTTSQADRIWSEHLIWPWKATIWIRFIKGKLVFQNEKQWELLQKVKMKQIYWCHHALKDRILISVSVFIITISLVTATAYYHCTCSVHFIHTMQFQLYVRFSKSSSSSLNKSIKSTPSSSLVMQQLIIYMSISTSESTEAHILMTWMSQTFLRHKRISVKIMALLRSSWCSTCHYIVRILSASISNPVRI